MAGPDWQFRMYVHVYVYVRVRAYVGMYVCMYVCMYRYVEVIRALYRGLLASGRGDILKNRRVS